MVWAISVRSYNNYSRFAVDDIYLVGLPGELNVVCLVYIVPVNL